MSQVTSKLLPQDAREMLQRAATAVYESNFDRIRAIEAATVKIKQMYPEYFTKEEE